MDISKIFNRFRLSVFLYWSFAAPFFCYYVIYFESARQISATQIGIMMSIYTISAVIGQSVLGYLSDKLRSIKKVLLTALFLASVVISTFPFHNQGAFFYVAMALIGFLQAPLPALIDSWIMKYLSRYKKEHQYGTIRCFGSFGWAITAFYTSFLIFHIDWHTLFIVSAFFALAGIATLATLRDPYDEQDAPHSNTAPTTQNKQITPWGAVKELVKVRSYLFIVIILFFHFLGMQTAYNFLGLIMKNAGGSVLNLGTTYLLDAGSEIFTMILSVHLLKRFSQKHLILAAIAIYMVRFALILYFRTPQAVMLCSILQGIAYGTMFPALRNYIYTIAPAHLKTTAFSVGEAFYLNLAVILGGIIGGIVVDVFGVFTMLYFCLASCCLSFALLFINLSMSTKTKLPLAKANTL